MLYNIPNSLDFFLPSPISPLPHSLTNAQPSTLWPALFPDSSISHTAPRSSTFDSYQRAWQLGNGWFLQTVIPEVPAELLWVRLGLSWRESCPCSFLPITPPTAYYDTPHKPKLLKVEMPSKIKVFPWFKKSKSLKISLTALTYFKHNFITKLKTKFALQVLKNSSLNLILWTLTSPWETVEGNGIPSSAGCSSWFEEVKWLSDNENGRQLLGLELFFWPFGLQDLSSPTRDRTRDPCSRSMES